MDDQPAPPSAAPLESSPPTRSLWTRRFSLEWPCGVVLPLITITTEAFSGWCASEYFDPLPTRAHLVLAYMVPLANAWLLLRLANKVPGRPDLVAAASGATVAATLLFALPFLPVLPIAFIGLALFGIGIFPLTPPLALLVSIRIARRVRNELWSTRSNSRWRALGFAAAGLTLLLADLPKTATNLGLRMASAESQARRQRGVALLRAFGSTDYLLRACYDRAGLPLDLVSVAAGSWFPERVGPAEARSAFYRVTGAAFNTVAPPPFNSRRGGNPTSSWDFDQATTSIGAPLKGLSLASSRLDGSIDPDAALAYVEWTLEFKNDGGRPREARALVALPPGAVVSRVTLWMGGEEREAAFGSRGQVRQAYERVVEARRDPILVTTAGPDLVLVQCFPVNPGEAMKARLGITAPLLLDDPSRGELLLPRLLDRNFAVRAEATNAIWIETKGRFAGTPAPYSLEPLSTGGQALRGDVTETALAGEARTISALRDPSRVVAWAPREGTSPAIRQTLRRRASTPIRRLVVVLDGSRGASASGPVLAAALKRIPESLEVAVVLAADVTSLLAPPRPGGQSAALAVAKVSFRGGADNVPALVQAWDLAASSPAGVVLWVHAPQPVRFGGTAALDQRWARRPTGPRLLAFPVRDGPNQVLEELGVLTAISRWPRRGPLVADLDSAIDQIVGRTAPVEAWREEGANAPKLSASTPTSGHIRRLWAADRVRSALQAGDAASRKAAVQIAILHRVVTQVSGAVVLETQAQYQDAGLQPPEAQSIPTIPEPETWLLLIVVACALAFVLRRRQRERLA